MRRKIEKYLAKRQGVDETKIAKTDDGRYDFMDDLDGVLASVRGKEGKLGRIKSDTKKNKKSFLKKSKKYDNMTSCDPRLMHMPPYIPYGMSHHGMPMYSSDMSVLPHPGSGNESLLTLPPMSHPMSHLDQRPPMMLLAPSEGVSPNASESGSASAPQMNTSRSPPLRLSLWDDDQSKGSSSVSPYVSMSITPGTSLNSIYRPKEFASGCLSSSRKAMFESPSAKSIGGNLGMTLGTPNPSAMDISGMTPLTNLKETFTTPYSKEMFKQWSPEDGMSLNKALFADEGNRQPKTPNFTPREMKIVIGGSDHSVATAISDMHYNRVSISPMSYKISPMSYKTQDSESMPPPTAPRHVHYTESRDDCLTASASKIHSFMPPMVLNGTPRNVSRNLDNSRDVSDPSPLDTTLTPVGSYDQSFWGRQLGFSPPQHATFTPFKSPAVPMSKKKEGRALATLSANTIHNSTQKSKDTKEVQEEVNELKEEVNELKEEVNEVKEEVNELKEEVNEVKEEVNEVKEEVNEVKEETKEDSTEAKPSNKTKASVTIHSPSPPKRQKVSQAVAEQ
jgi:uncharacterized protein YoxC